MSVWRRWRASNRQLRDLHLQVARLETENNTLGKSLRDARNKHLAAELAGKQHAATVRRIREIVASHRSVSDTTLYDVIAGVLMEAEAGGDHG